jgi:hypothetical protein
MRLAGLWSHDFLDLNELLEGKGEGIFMGESADNQLTIS